MALYLGSNKVAGNIVDKKDVYSTSEVKTNKVYIDENDKECPVYRKIFRGNKVSGTDLNFPAINNIKEITELYGVLISNSASNRYHIPYYANSSIFINVECSSTGVIKVESGTSGYSNGTVKITIEYTKTTD